MTNPLDPQFTDSPIFQDAGPGEVNIIASLNEILKNLGYQDTRQWQTDADIVKAANMRPEGQIFFANRYWRRALGRLNADTSKERFLLSDDMGPEEYLSFFENGVAPAIVKLNA